MINMHDRFWGVAALLVLLLPAAAAAQVRGRVITRGGEPVDGARVELWSAAKREDARLTGSSGTFEFTAPPRTATGVVVSRIGFDAASLPIGTVADSIVVVLSERSMRLAPISVQGSTRSPCPNRDAPEARSLIIAAAGKYDHSPDSIAIRANLVGGSGTVSRPELGDIDHGDDGEGWRGVVGTPRSIRPAQGYGYAIQRSLLEDFVSWKYQELGSFFTQHFVDSTFVRYNTFSVHFRDREVTVVAFCSSGLGREAVGIEGTIQVTPAGTFQSASWKFRQPANRENVGGEVVFAPHPGGTRKPWLVPVSSFYWRQIVGSRDRFFQRWEQYLEWNVPPPESTLHRGRPPQSAGPTPADSLF